MALAQPPQPLTGAKDRPMLLNRQDHVLAATGVESASAAKDGTEYELISSYQTDQDE